MILLLLPSSDTRPALSVPARAQHRIRRGESVSVDAMRNARKLIAGSPFFLRVLQVGCLITEKEMVRIDTSRGVAGMANNPSLYVAKPQLSRESVSKEPDLSPVPIYGQSPVTLVIDRPLPKPAPGSLVEPRSVSRPVTVGQHSSNIHQSGPAHHHMRTA